MLLTDYFYSTHDATWDFAVQSGVRHGTIRLPEDPDFDITQRSHWETVYRRFTDFGIRPVVIEPMPNNLHDHIKEGDAQRDASIEKVIRMLELMSSFDIRTVCFNFMAHIGWLRTHNRIPERGGAFVTGFDEKSFVPPDDYEISEKQLWANYTYFLRAVIPYAEKYGVRLAPGRSAPAEAWRRFPDHDVLQEHPPCRAGHRAEREPRGHDVPGKLLHHGRKSL